MNYQQKRHNELLGQAIQKLATPNMRVEDIRTYLRAEGQYEWQIEEIFGEAQQIIDAADGDCTASYVLGVCNELNQRTPQDLIAWLIQPVNKPAEAQPAASEPETKLPVEPAPAVPMAQASMPPAEHAPTLQDVLNRVPEPDAAQKQPEPVPAPGADIKTDITEKERARNALADTAQPIAPPVAELLSEEEGLEQIFGQPAKREEPKKETMAAPAAVPVNTEQAAPTNIAGPSTQSSVSETSREGITQPAPIIAGFPVYPAREIAQKIINLGGHVIFFPRGQKRCMTSGWDQLATRDFAVVDQLTAKDPYSNVGVVGKPDGLWLFDDDQKVLPEYENHFGKIQTYRVRSVSGGTHLYLKQNELSCEMGNIAGKDANGEETWSARQNNKYVVAAGSSAHPNNDLNVPEVYYTVIDDLPVAEAPASFIEFLKMKAAETKKQISAAPEPRKKIPHGGIHDFLLTQAGRLRGMGLSVEAVEINLHELADKFCEAPIDHSKVTQVARSTEKWPEGAPTDLVLNQQPQSVQLANGEIAFVATDKRLSHDITDEYSEASIPPFDPSVIKGIYKQIVDVTTKGTTLEPQFIYSIAKTVVGAKMAGKVKFEDLDVEPLIYLALCAATGAGKGEAWRRIFKILTTKPPESMLLSGSLSCYAGIKIVNSADSGAGLKDAFFENPADQPLICYIDEVANLGHKANEKKNPEIIDTMGELANSTSISRVKAKKSNRQPSAKTKDNAYLTVVMCGQNAEVFTSAYAGRTKVGWWDRLTPEYGTPQETGSLPPISDADALRLLRKLNDLPYFGTMSKSPEANALLEQFWASQLPEIRKVARLKQELQIDAYVMAFGRGVKMVEKMDVEDAIKNFSRRLCIRRVMFRGEVPNRVGFYLSLIKELTEWMRKKLAEGFAPAEVARSWRDFEKKTNARRNNEEDIFARAMDYHVKHHLDKVPIKAKNGRIYEWYLPKPEEE